MAFTALTAGVSGLQAFSAGIGVISDNITNVHTPGYKETRMNFTTLVSETSGANYSPGGVQGKYTTLVSKSGVPAPTDSETDLSIDGAGFFTVKSATNATAGGEFLFTRAGSFVKDNEGYLQNKAGLYLMGWPTDAQGSLPNNLTDLTELRPINITRLSGTAEPTSRIDMRANLSSEAPINTVYSGPGDLATGVITDPEKFETNMDIVDSLGASHTIRIAAVKTAQNTWSYEIFGDQASEFDPVKHPNGLIQSGTLKFNNDASVDLANSTFNPSNAPDIYYASGAAPSPLTMNFGDDGTTEGFSQYATESTVLTRAVDGAVFGNVKGVSIDASGVVTAQFDNGLSQKVFQLPIATFPNPDGLTRRQGNAFGVSDHSGEFTMVRAGTAGGGTLNAYSLEGSTVDLASEFAELIKTQRAFSASTRIISTADEILTELTRI